MAFGFSLLRRSEVEDATGLSRSTLYQRISQGLFTRPVLIGPRSVAWPALEVEALNYARIAGVSEDAIRALVGRLHAARRSPATKGEAA